MIALGGNLIPGHYMIVASHGEFTTKRTVFIKGPNLVIKSAEATVIHVAAWDHAGWHVENITLTVQNMGDCLAYVEAVSLEIPELNETLSFSAHHVKILPGKTKTFTATCPFSGKPPITKPGTYKAIATIDFGFRKWSHDVILTTPTPELRLLNATFGLEYDAFWDEWHLENVTLTLENTGEAPAYIFMIYVIIPDVDEDYDRFFDTAVKPGETITLLVDLTFFIIDEPGTYEVSILIDIGYTIVEYEVRLTVG